MAHNVYYVEFDEKEKQWRVERPKADRASRVFEEDEKRKAIEEAHRLSQGGIVHIEGPNGKWRKEQRSDD